MPLSSSQPRLHQGAHCRLWLPSLTSLFLLSLLSLAVLLLLLLTRRRTKNNIFLQSLGVVWCLPTQLPGKLASRLASFDGESSFSSPLQNSVFTDFWSIRKHIFSGWKIDKNFLLYHIYERWKIDKKLFVFIIFLEDVT